MKKERKFVEWAAFCACLKHKVQYSIIVENSLVMIELFSLDELLKREVQSGLKREKSSQGNSGSDCDCLPGCTSLVYNAETSQADFMWEHLFRAYKANMSEFPGVQITRINIFFKEQQFITSERNELYGQTDFLANCGGILGLFTGFSFLSIVEVVYFLTLKLMCNVKKYGRHYWSGSPQLVNNDMYIHKK